MLKETIAALIISATTITIAALIINITIAAPFRLIMLKLTIAALIIIATLIARAITAPIATNIIDYAEIKNPNL